MQDKNPEELSEDELSDVTGGLLAHELTHVAKPRLTKGKGTRAEGGSKLRPSDKWITDGGDTKI